MPQELSESQYRFFELLEESAPFLSFLWSVEKRELNIKGLENYLTTASHHEAILARFFAGLWLNENKFNFDLLEATGKLDSEYRLVISEWVLDPFWP